MKNSPYIHESGSKKINAPACSCEPYCSKGGKRKNNRCEIKTYYVVKTTTKSLLTGLRLLIIRARFQSAALVAFLPQEAKRQYSHARDVSHGSRNNQAQTA